MTLLVATALKNIIYYENMYLNKLRSHSFWKKKGKTYSLSCLLTGGHVCAFLH